MPDPMNENYLIRYNSLDSNQNGKVRVRLKEKGESLTSCQGKRGFITDTSSDGPRHAGHGRHGGHATRHIRQRRHP